jgi:hypothetical protein
LQIATANVISLCLSLPAGVVKREAEAEPKKKNAVSDIVSGALGGASDLGADAINTLTDGAINTVTDWFG